MCKYFPPATGFSYPSLRVSVKFVNISVLIKIRLLTYCSQWVNLFWCIFYHEPLSFRSQSFHPCFASRVLLALGLTYRSINLSVLVVTHGVMNEVLLFFSVKWISNFYNFAPHIYYFPLNFPCTYVLYVKSICMYIYVSFSWHRFHFDMVCCPPFFICVWDRIKLDD